MRREGGYEVVVVERYLPAASRLSLARLPATDMHVEEKLWNGILSVY